MVSSPVKMIGLRTQYEQTLHNVVLITETAMGLKERARAGEKYVCHLRSLAVRASRAISTIHASGKTFILLSQRMVGTALRHLETLPVLDQTMLLMKQEYERLLAILDRELLELDDVESVDAGLPCDPNDGSTLAGIEERLRNLETKQKLCEQIHLPPSSSARSFRSEVDEKYPENWSRDSLIDINNVVNLPPVPEDAFSGFSKPIRTSSLSSLKSIRKVKLYLQRAANSEDEESEFDEHEMSMSDDLTSSSEGGEARPAAISAKKGGGLCNIKEETPQDP